ncbi:hypothetical protein MKW92_016079 [Papaver armeniacum]|nr:hypothetical protein MKW92_016079 [Papaver armeniacum]
MVDTISSWLDLDDPNIIPQDLQQLLDFQMLDTDTASTSTNMEYEHPYSQCNLPLNLPRPDSPFPLDLQEFDNNIISPPEDHYYHPLLPGHDEVIPDQPVDKDASCEMYLNVMAESSFQSVGVDQHFQTDSDNLITMASISPSSVSEHPQQILPGHEGVILDQPVDKDANCETYLNVMAEGNFQSVGVDQHFQTDSDNLITMASISPSSVSEHVPRQLRLKKQKLHNIEKPPKSSTKRRNQSTTTAAAATNSSVADDDDEMEEDIDGEPKTGKVNCKNLVSERNRRKRLSQQLLDLRTLVPNITKMDKRSVLVDAISYLRNMQEETKKLEKEIKEKHLLQKHQPRFINNDIMEGDEDDHEHDLSDDTRARTSVPGTASKPKPQIIEIDIEKMEEKRFIVKITCNGAKGVAGDIFRVMETTGFEISYAALDQIKPQQVLSTVFIKVKKQDKMTEEKLKDCIISSALRCGLNILLSSSC